MTTKKKIYVGLSGGVDSAVSAALLKEEGHDVTGVFIKIWSPEFLECTWREDRLDAMRVAVHLDIPFLEIDLSKEYRDTVIRDMIENYRKGITPNPDVLCNRSIKFGAFLWWALEQGADAIATGHYARILESAQGRKLLKGVDAGKDQSYFLYRLGQHDLERAYFPVGGYTKAEIREKARDFGLPNASRPDSQGLCFVGDVSMRDFLTRFIVLKKGALLDERGMTVGEHEGAALYTIGQRHGFRLVSGAPEGPYFVTKVDAAGNVVHVSKKKAATESTEAKIDAVHWIGVKKEACDAVQRYHARSVRARILEGSATFDVPVQVTPGQSLVFYEGDECLGGAIVLPR